MTSNSTLPQTRKALYDLAQQADIPGRSNMSRDELLAALQADRSQPAVHREASRVDAFSNLAAAYTEGRTLMAPSLLAGEARRLHVRQTLREDHHTRIARGDGDAEVKFDKLAGSLFSFFRGTALLFYRDMVAEDAWMPTVLTLGDVHPSNFGIMPNAHNVPIFGVNDFDEAYYAPFTWDIKRGAVGFMLAAQEKGDKSRKRQRKIVRHFVNGYIDGICRFAEESNELDHEMRSDNAPELLKELFEKAEDETRAEWLASDYLDETLMAYRTDKDSLVPITARRDEFQTLIERMVQDNNIDVPDRAGEMRVKDVAIRRGQGTASLGLARYYVLIEGPAKNGTDDLIIELKQARRSALTGLVPPSDFDFNAAGERIAHAQTVQLVRGDLFFGHVEFEGLSFMTRERGPYKQDMSLGKLSKKGWRQYAHICGEALAHAHAMSDESGLIDYDIEPRIVSAIGGHKLFKDDIVRWAEESADRLRRDHQAFIADYELGAFRTVDVAYR